MKKNLLKQLFILSIIVVLSAIVLFTLGRDRELSNANAEHNTQVKANSLHKGSRTIRHQAEQPIYNTQIIPTDINKDDANQHTQSANLPEQCKENNIGLLIAQKSFQDFRTDLATNIKFQQCAAALGLVDKCFLNEPTRDDFTQKCEEDALLIRSTIIDRLTDNSNLSDLDTPALSNKLFSALNSNEHDNSKIFEIANLLLAKDYQNPEAHNVRGYYGMEVFKNTSDVGILDKIDESSDYLATSERERDVQRSLLYKYASNLAKFLVDKNDTALAESELLASKYIEKFPNDPDGYYLMMQTSGYKGDKEATVKWLEKGLSFGSSQPNYITYQAVKSAIQTNGLKSEYLGLRIDPAKQFNPSDLVKNQ